MLATGASVAIDRLHVRGADRACGRMQLAFRTGVGRDRGGGTQTGRARQGSEPRVRPLKASLRLFIPLPAIMMVAVGEVMCWVGGKGSRRWGWVAGAEVVWWQGRRRLSQIGGAEGGGGEQAPQQDSSPPGSWLVGDGPGRCKRKSRLGPDSVGTAIQRLQAAIHTVLDSDKAARSRRDDRFV